MSEWQRTAISVAGVVACVVAIASWSVWAAVFVAGAVCVAVGEIR